MWQERVRSFWVIMYGEKVAKVLLGIDGCSSPNAEVDTQPGGVIRFVCEAADASGLFDTCHAEAISLVQPNAPSTISVVEYFYGEELTAGLLENIASTPRDQLLVLADKIAQYDRTLQVAFGQRAPFCQRPDTRVT